MAEVGDIRRFDDPKQLQKLAGYAIVKNQSGKHKGESHISYRGRKRLRYVLYEAAIRVVGHSPEFRSIHQYYTTRDKNPLKKMQSMIAVACKLIRIFYMILQTGVTYDAAKMVGVETFEGRRQPDSRRTEQLLSAAGTGRLNHRQSGSGHRQATGSRKGVATEGTHQETSAVRCW